MNISETDFTVYTIGLLAITLILPGVIVLQVYADRYQEKQSSRHRDRHTSILLYAVYVSGLGCCIVGFLLHASTSVVWCEKIGLIPCFAMLGLSKVFLYAFFLRRAKLAQGIVVHPWLRLLFNYIGPVYLFCYWMIYCAITAFVFTGSYSHDGSAISNCNIMGEWAAGFSTFAGFVELFNSVAFVSIFSYPLLRAMHEVKVLSGSSQVDHSTDHIIRLEFISVMKWNVGLTTIASLSSVTNLFMLLVAGHYIWLFCLGDPMINAVCTFLMIAPNRVFVSRFGCVSTESLPEMENKKSVPTSTKSDVKSTTMRSKTHSESEASLPEKVDVVENDDVEVVTQ
eukprot:23478_1